MLSTEAHGQGTAGKPTHAQAIKRPREGGKVGEAAYMVHLHTGYSAFKTLSSFIQPLGTKSLPCANRPMRIIWGYDNIT